MKKTIYKYFFHEFIRYFFITLFALTAIIWTIQTVNFLDLVTEDGHALKIYFFYSFLVLSKVLTKLVPFTFLIATILTIVKLEKDNELIILWTSGLNKIYIVNLIFFISLLIMLVQVLLSNIINPASLNFSRGVLKNSQLQFIPSLLKEKQFNDTVANLTIFVNKKNTDGKYENIFIRDEGSVLTQISNTSSTIFAKTGYVNDKNLVLFDGNIQKLEKDGNVSVVKFSKTSINLGGLSTKTISEPKIQETSTLQIINCIKQQYRNISMDKSSHNCSRYDKNFTDTKIEINKRFGMPMFIPLIALICCFLLTSRKDKKISGYGNYIYFFFGFLTLSCSEVFVRYSGFSWNHTLAYYSVPLLMLPLLYLLLLRTFKYENLN